MADNVQLDAGTGGEVCATDDCGAAGQVQRVKLSYSGDGVATGILADAKGLEVQQPTAADLNMTEASAAAIKTAVEIMDDWDESDRAKVNPIVGQAGIAASTGVDGVTVPRVTLATNVPLPAGTNAIGKLAANTGVDIGDVDVLSSALPAGAATSALQLADGHNVTVDNISTNEVFVRGSQSAGAAVDGEVVTVQGIASMTPIATTESSPIAGFATEAKQLADGHNVTIDNAAAGAAVNIQDGGNVITVDGSVTADLGSNNDVVVAGDVAHDVADSGNPTKVGFKNKLFDGTAPGTTVSAENDRVDGIADGYGRQYVETTHPFRWDAVGDYSSAQTNATLKAAPGANLSLFITDIVISNGVTTGGATGYISLLDGSGGSVKLKIFPGAYGGATIHLKTPIKLTANTLLAVTSTTVTYHSIMVSGYTAAVTGGV